MRSVDGAVRDAPWEVGAEEPISWLERRRASSSATCSRIPFAASREWRMIRGRLEHRSRRFFSVEGLRSTAGRLSRESTEQPIIVQPEVGILGFLAQRREGRIRLLGQAKYEPGNEGGVQIAPTLQATLSNYRRVHGGREPVFLDQFLGNTAGKVVVDQLESEQGTRFFHKRNRNMVVEIEEGVSIEHDDSFRWISCSELSSLMKRDNLVNTDARSVVSCLPTAWLDSDEELRTLRRGIGFGRDLSRSMVPENGRGSEKVHSLESWCAAMKARSVQTSEIVSLEELSGWAVLEDRIARPTGGCFAVEQIRIADSGREVDSWDQPIVSSHGEGLIGFLCQYREGRPYFLVQAIAEPGLFDHVEFTTTLQCQPGSWTGDGETARPPLAEHFESPSTNRILLSVRQSEEGGRFLADQNHYMVVQLDDHDTVDLPDNYRWMTLGEMKAMRRFNHLFTNEARSLIACLML